MDISIYFILFGKKDVQKQFSIFRLVRIIRDVNPRHRDSVFRGK